MAVPSSLAKQLEIGILQVGLITILGFEFSSRCEDNLSFRFFSETDDKI
jgi:hypothetical protein